MWSGNPIPLHSLVVSADARIGVAERPQIDTTMSANAKRDALITRLMRGAREDGTCVASNSGNAGSVLDMRVLLMLATSQVGSDKRTFCQGQDPPCQTPGLIGRPERHVREDNDR